MNNFTKGVCAAVLVLLAFPTVAFAFLPVIPVWTDPARSATYSFTDHIVANGTWQLPPGWVGLIYVYGDGTGIQKIDVSTGKSTLPLPSNVGGIATSTGSFVFDIGPQTDGAHDIQVGFIGGTECAVNRALNELTPPPLGAPFSPSCDKTDWNYISVWVLPTRTYTVGIPLFPRMVVTPSTDPALNFSDIVFGTAQTRSFFVSNTGDQTLTGSISGLSAPFSCSPCGYTINPGDAPVPINITFTPTTVPTSFSQDINFSCIGSFLGCEGGPFVTAYQSRHIIGNSVDSGVAPQITLSTSLIDYGTVNLGVPISDRPVTITNTGGGILNGTVTFNSGEYTCTGPCSYSILAGASKTILIHYVPTVSGTYIYNASFTGGAGKVVTLQSTVNDQPILQTYSSWNGTTYSSSGGFLNFGTKIDVGECRTQVEYIRNNGAGLLSGSVDIPIQPDTSLKTPGFTCYANCTYTNLSHDNVWHRIDLLFCPVDDNPASTLMSLSNTANPPAGGSTTLTGQGNTAPIGTASTLGLSFGSVLVGGSKTMSITVTNTGLGTLSGSVGALPTGYTCSPAPCSYDLAAGVSITLSFTLSPIAAVGYNGSVVLSDVGTLFLQGNGVAPDFKMSYSGDPLSTCPGATCLPSSPKDYDVGATTFGGSPAVQNKTFYLYVRNMGSGGSVSYDFPDTAHFFCMNPAMCTKTIAPGNGYVIPYEFRPDAATDFTESLVVTYDYGAGPQTLTLNLTGHSVSAPYLSVAPNANIFLGNIAVGSTATATFMVTNLGVGALNGSVSFPGLAGAAPTVGLVGHWTFDDADINWTTHQVSDTSGVGNTGWLPGPTSAIGKVNEALNFTGRGGVNIPHVTGFIAGNTQHTMAAWIKVNALPPSRAWIALLGSSASGAEHWLIDSAGGTHFGVWGSAAQQTQPILPVGTWVHVATTFDGITLRSYVNGVLSQSVPATFNFSGVPLTLGLVSPIFPSESDFNGVLDDVRLFNLKFFDADIAQIYSGTYSDTGNLLGQWTFDDPTVVWSQLKVLDSSVRANNGVLSHVPSSATGKLGQALDFNGTKSDMVTTSSLFNNPQDFTIGAWFKTTSASGRKIIGFENTKTDFSASYGRKIWMGTDGKVRFNVWGAASGVTSLGALNDGAWHHAVGTHTAAGNTVLYIDGIAQESLTLPASIYSGYWRIGGYSMGVSPYGSDGYFIGTIDDARVYNRALSATEVSDLYGSGIAADLSVFTCVTGCTFSNLLNGQSQNVQIEFTPTAPLGYIGYPLFSSNGGMVGYPAAPYPSISGTGVLDPIISVSPSVLGFPDTNQGFVRRLDITISNIGLGNLSGNISPVKAAGLNFYCVLGCNYNVAPGIPVTATIEFSPQSVSPPTLASTMTFTSNASNGTQLVNVFGNGVLEPILDLRAADTNFGKVVIGKFKEKTFTIGNSGTSDLGSGTFVVTGPFTCVNPVDAGDGLCHYSITAGGSAVITIRFSPLVTGLVSGSVSLSGVPAARFTVTGTGVSPTIRIIEK